MFDKAMGLKKAKSTWEGFNNPPLEKGDLKMVSMIYQGVIFIYAPFLKGG